MATIPKDGLITDDLNISRCWWPADDTEYIKYHDTEWGHPAHDDQRLFEKICLEGFQAGLSWLTILRKRENFRKAFDDFDYHKIALYTESDIERLVKDAGIIRHRGKITSTINNAHKAIEMEKEFGSLGVYFWSFEPEPKMRPNKCDYKSLSAFTTTTESTALSKDLKRRGWSFVGPTTCYAFMQAMGIVNDHVEGCHCRDLIEKKRQKFKRPTKK
jgi:DNA-3-methyladenine glycosylase I